MDTGLERASLCSAGWDAVQARVGLQGCMPDYAEAGSTLERGSDLIENSEGSRSAVNDEFALGQDS